MKAVVLGLAEIERDGERYDHDIVITAWLKPPSSSASQTEKPAKK
jgi:hypothetical protein